MSEIKVGTVTLEYTMLVKQYCTENTKYTFKEPVELAPGKYSVFIDGNMVRFEKTADFITEEDKMLANLLERSEHQ